MRWIDRGRRGGVWFDVEIGAEMDVVFSRNRCCCCRHFRHCYKPVEEWG
jgi:hypothetical protein